MIVSRYVTPADTGTVAMVTTFVSFIVLFDTGLTWATVQTKNLAEEQLNSLFWIGVLLGLFLWLACIVAGPFLALFYHNENLKLLCPILGLSPFLNSLATQPAALLRRQLLQKTLNSIDTVSIVCSSLIGITMAISHTGYWAIVAQLVMLNLIKVILLLFFSKFKPGKPRYSKDALPLLKFGGWLAMSNYVCYFQLYLGSILMGYAFGDVVLGNYMKAFGLKTLPTMYATMVVTDVMVASLAALQMDKERMGAAYRKALVLTAFIGCPAGALLFPLAPEAVRFLYGSQWELAIPLLKWLSLPAVMLPVSTTTIWLFLAAGKGREQLRMNLWLSSVTVVAYLAALKFLKTPQEFIAIEAFLFALPFPIVNLIASHKAVGISLRATIIAILPIICCSLAASYSVVIFDKLFIKADMVWEMAFIIKSFFGIIIYIILSFIFNKHFMINILYNIRLFFLKKIFIKNRSL